VFLQNSRDWIAAEALFHRVADHYGFNHKDVKEIAEALFDEIIVVCAVEGREVRLAGFGNFFLKDFWRKAPTGQGFIRPSLKAPYRSLRMRPSRTLTKFINDELPRRSKEGDGGTEDPPTGSPPAEG
jgi:nucleoid DNA-binding protein